MRILLVLCAAFATACIDGEITSGGGAAALRYKIFYIGGSSNATNAKTEVYASTDFGATWNLVGNLPIAVYSPGVAVWQGKIIVAGGYDGSAFRNEVYSSTDGFTWNIIGSLPTATLAGRLIVFGSKLWYVGGTTGSAVATIFYSSNGGATWSTCGTGLSVAKSSGGVAVLNGTVYYVGGEAGPWYASVHKTSDVSCSSGWNLETSLSGSRTRIDLQVYNGKIWTFGGYDGAAASADVFEGTASGTITWTTHANKLPSPRFGVAATVLNNLMYVIGGYDFAGPALSSQVLTSADGDTWTLKGNLPQGRLYGGIAVLPIQ